MLRRFLIRRAIRRMNKVNFSRVTNGWLTHDGRERTYALYTPPQPSASMPLLIALHGGGGRGSGMIHITYGGFNRLAERETFVVVYPDGVDKRWNDGRGLTEWRAHRERVDDVGFIAALIDQISAEQPIDRRRVYVTGISNGGMMSYRLACELGDRIAAIAPVVAALPAHLSGCVPPHAMPIILMNGTDDPLIPYQGGQIRAAGKALGPVLSADDTIAFWLARNGCGTTPLRADVLDADPNDGIFIRRTFYGGCDQGAEVALYSVQGGGHTWPGGLQYFPQAVIGPTSRDVDACEVIWDFCKRFALP